MAIKHVKVLGLATVAALGAIALIPPNNRGALGDPLASEARVGTTSSADGLPTKAELNTALQRVARGLGSDVWITVLDRSGTVQAVAFTRSGSSEGLPLYDADGELIGRIRVSGDPTLASKIRKLLRLDNILARASAIRKPPQ